MDQIEFAKDKSYVGHIRAECKMNMLIICWNAFCEIRSIKKHFHFENRAVNWDRCLQAYITTENF